MKIVYVEIGVGNPSLVSSEMDEVRTACIRSGKFLSVYLRIWIGRHVLILDSLDGFKHMRKDKPMFKLVLGIRRTRC